MKMKTLFAGTALALFALAAHAQQKWDMPTPYPASNFHTANIQAAELAQALATGVVNANITSGATGYDTKSWEYVKFFYDVQAWLPKNVIIVNQKSFAALDQGAQQAVLKAAQDAEARGWKVSEEKTKFYLEQLAKNGMRVEAPSASFRNELKKIGDTMTNEWVKTAGADGQAAIDAYRK